MEHFSITFYKPEPEAGVDFGKNRAFNCWAHVNKQSNLTLKVSNSLIRILNCTVTVFKFSSKDTSATATVE